MVSKDDLIKFVVVVIVLAFMLEVFSFRGSSNYQGDDTPQETPTPIAQGIIGSAQLDAAISSYPDNVIAIYGPGAANDSALISRLRDLSAEGKLAYFNSANPDNLNLVLSQGANVSEIGWGLVRDFPVYSLSARAYLALPAGADFETASGMLSAPIGQRVSVQLEPIVPEGSSIAVLITAMLSNGSVSEMMVEVAELGGTALINGTVSSLSDQWLISSEIPWSGRTAINESNLSSALSAIYPNSSVSYELRSTVIFGNATAEQQENIKNLSYALIVVGNAALLDDDFTNQSKAEQDFREILGENASLSFMPSSLSINITSSTFNESQFGGLIGAGNLAIGRLGEFQLNETLEIEGNIYLLPGGAHITRAFAPNVTQGEQLSLPVAIIAKGARITIVE